MMRIGTRLLSAAAGVMLAGAAAIPPAAAMPLGHPSSLAQLAAGPGEGQVETVQWRGGGFRGGGFRGGGFHGGGFRGGHWGGGGWRGGYGYRRFGPGPLIGGLAAGAIIGGALASPYAYGYASPYPDAYVDNYDYGAYAGDDTGGDAAAYCAQRFKSYNPASGTYLGYDGQRHPCP